MKSCSSLQVSPEPHGSRGTEKQRPQWVIVCPKNHIYCYSRAPIPDALSHHAHLN
jgi:hypothetical protein